MKKSNIVHDNLTTRHMMENATAVVYPDDVVTHISEALLPSQNVLHNHPAKLYPLKDLSHGPSWPKLSIRFDAETWR